MNAIPTCCDLCRGLTGGVAWTWYSPSLSCRFYSSVADINYSYSSSYSSGKINDSPIWKCNEQENKWYYSSTLTWIPQTEIVNSSLCCEDCFSNVLLTCSIQIPTLATIQQNFILIQLTSTFWAISTGSPILSLSP